jgi:SAM-dependent methyltransferase
VWVPRFACPDCRAVLSGDDELGLWCAACGRRFDQTAGIYRLLPGNGATLSDAFVRQYRAVRERDGHRQPAPDYYRMLPVVQRDHPRAGEWRIRRESYANLQSYAMPAVWRGPIRVLDAGAGSGWLAHRLASFGHLVAALDRLDDEMDGLGAIRHYPVAFTAVQADFNALPFPDREFDLVVLNGSLHYAADPARTLAEARRVMAIGGALAVMDSPMFADDRDGEAMVEAQLRAFAVDYGIVDAVQPGTGFLTYAQLERAATLLGLRGRFIPSRGPLLWRMRRHVGRVRLGRAPASFGLWVGQ